MDGMIRSCFENLQSPDRIARYEAYHYLLNATEEKVDWAYEVWDDLKKDSGAGRGNPARGAPVDRNRGRFQVSKEVFNPIFGHIQLDI